MDILRRCVVIEFASLLHSVSELINNGVGLGRLEQRSLKDVLLLFEIIDVGLNLLQKDKAESKKRFSVEIFDVFGSFDLI